MKKKLVSVLLMGTVVASMFLTGCSNINKDATLVNIDGGKDKVTLGYGNFVARYTQSLYDATYLSYYGTSIWTEEEDGKTFEEQVKEEILDSLEEEYLLNKHAEEYGIKLSEEDEKAIEKAAKAFMKDNDEDTLKAMGATKDIVKTYLKNTTIAERMTTAIKEETEVKVTKEDAAQRTITYAYLSSVSDTNESGETIYYDDDEKAEIKKMAEELASSSDLETDGAAVGADVQTTSYGKNDESLDEEVIKAADALAEGETSGVVEVKDDGYYIIHLDSAYDEEATTSAMEEMEENQRTEHYDSVIEEWKDAIKWKVDKKLWKKVAFDSFFKVTTNEEE